MLRGVIAPLLLLVGCGQTDLSLPSTCADPGLHMCADFEDDLSDFEATDVVGSTHLQVSNVEQTMRGLRSAIVLTPGSVVVSSLANTADLPAPITIDLWINWDGDVNNTHQEVLIDNLDQYKVYIDVAVDIVGESSIVLRCAGGGADAGRESTVPIALHVWQHVACVLDDTIAVYLDGQLVHETPGIGEISVAGTTQFHVGSSGVGSGSDRFVGGVDDVRIWNRALDGDALRSIVQAFAAEPQE